MLLECYSIKCHAADKQAVVANMYEMDILKKNCILICCYVWIKQFPEAVNSTSVTLTLSLPHSQRLSWLVSLNRWGLSSNTVLLLSWLEGWKKMRWIKKKKKVPISEELTFEGGGTLRLCVFSCRWGGSVMGGSMPGNFTPGEAPSLTRGTEDSWPKGDWRQQSISQCC